MRKKKNTHCMGSLRRNIVGPEGGEKLGCREALKRFLLERTQVIS